MTNFGFCTTWKLTYKAGLWDPTIPEKRAYMDIKTFKYQGVVVGVMFGGYNGSPLDDTWLIVPGYGDQGIAGKIS